MKITETRKLSFDALRNLCIRKNWYTCGDNEEYFNILNFAKNNDMTTENIAYIANDIIEHSDPKRFADCEPNGIKPIENVMFEIADVCVTFFEVEEA